MAQKKSRPRLPIRARHRSVARSDHDDGIVTRPIQPADLPDPRSDEFAYLVAKCAWHDGLTANAIARLLFNDSSARHLMQVKRALKRAHATDVLRFVPPVAQRMRDDLDRLVNGKSHPRPIRFHVVQDSDLAAGAPVYAKAAEFIADFIRNTVEQHRHLDQPGETVICNAGGRTVSETVRALARNPPVFDGTREEARLLASSLRFVSGNAAYEAEQFHRSANFLSVTMAELFEAGHLALPQREDAVLAERHVQYVEQASLIICGAGTCKSNNQASLMAQYFKKNGWTLPDSAEGDLSFNLLDKRGYEVELPDLEAQAFMRQQNPTLSLTRLMHVAHNNRVLVILDAENPKEKTAIGTAILKRRYATDVVLGSRLAAEIIQHWPSAS